MREAWWLQYVLKIDISQTPNVTIWSVFKSQVKPSAYLYVASIGIGIKGAIGAIIAPPLFISYLGTCFMKLPAAFKANRQ